MTLLCKCNWCGNVVEYNSDCKTLEFDGSKYHYCKDCVLDVNIALSVGKNGEQGRYKKIADCWTEMDHALTKWYNGSSMHLGHRELEKAFIRFHQKLAEIEEEK